MCRLSIKDEELISQAKDIIEEVIEQKKVNAVLRDGGTEEDARALLLATSPKEGRRGSAAMVAMRRRTLSEEMPDERRGGTRRGTVATVSPTRRRGAQDKDSPPESPISPGTQESLLMNRKNRRSSIAALAQKAGLGGEVSTSESRSD